MIRFLMLIVAVGALIVGGVYLRQIIGRESQPHAYRLEELSSAIC